MKKWICSIGFVALCLLTGCGREDKLLNHIDTQDLDMINTSEQAEEYEEQLDREDHLKWVYDKKEINELIQLNEVIKAEAEKAGCRVSEEALFGEGGVELWMAHANQRVDPKKETLSQPGIYVEGETQESVQKVCAAIEKAGYPGVMSCFKSGQIISRGLRFNYSYDEEEEVGAYSLNVSVSNYLGYYPERYKKIIDILVEGGYFVNNIQCFGGVVNRIVAERDDEETLCREIMLQIDQEGKLVEFNAFMDDLTQTEIKQDAERKTLVELLTMLTAERNDVIAFVNNLTKKSGSGAIAKDYTWFIQKLWEEGYMLRVQ